MRRTPFLAFGEDLEQQFGAAFVEFHAAQFVDAEQVDTAVAGDGLGLKSSSFDARGGIALRG
ncbi:hypothetical protein Ari01nite_87890 [Paractinoplanes rishiriensis]|uniref:Uncharacterized protein n=1 Tax=Paractinoplanes rishiriensis TaxID=1050105 RepID=A0A919K7X3_9ACTN|nr:hypothetical protein Ari01nite_87890 [Actinoplanes rishiriensis]